MFCSLIIFQNVFFFLTFSGVVSAVLNKLLDFQAFLLFDMDGDGCIDYNDLRATLVSLGDRVDDQVVRNMMAEVCAIIVFMLI